MTFTCNYTLENGFNSIDLVKTKRHLTSTFKKLTTHNDILLLDYVKLMAISNIKFIEIRNILIENIIDNA